MPAPATLDEFLLLVQRSGLVADDRLDEFLRELDASRSMPADPAQLADRCVRAGLLTFLQAEQLLQGKWRGFAIGKYKVLERIGFGGMGQVYLCEHERMRRKVAVKVLPTTGQEPGALERFEREARAAAALDHPNIVRAFDLDQAGDLHFLVMEYIDGPTFYDLVRQNGPLEVPRACHYVRQAALGLQHAHEHGLVHRDIKPSNLVVDRHGMVKVLDLGLARFHNDHADRITQKYDANHVLGTADYVAPEQTRDSSAVDIRADIYSLGSTFYFLLTGRPPFPDGSVQQKLLWHRSKEPEPIRSLRPEVPIGVTVIVEKMMAKQPERRFPTPLELAHVLAPWTQAPVPPPTDIEMPALSPAAQQAGQAVPGQPPPPPPALVPAPEAPPRRRPAKATRPPVRRSSPPVPANPFAAPAGPVEAPKPFPLTARERSSLRRWTRADWIKTLLVVVAGVVIGCTAGWYIYSQRGSAQYPSPPGKGAK